MTRTPPYRSVDTEIAELARDLVTLPRPIDMNEAGRIRERIEQLAQLGPRAPRAACAECTDLRGRLRNIYHLTLNGGDPYLALTAIREASGPGAPPPPATAPDRNVTACDEDLNDRGELLRFLGAAEGEHA